MYVTVLGTGSADVWCAQFCILNEVKCSILGHSDRFTVNIDRGTSKIRRVNVQGQSTKGGSPVCNSFMR